MSKTSILKKSWVNKVNKEIFLRVLSRAPLASRRSVCLSPCASCLLLSLVKRRGLMTCQTETRRWLGGGRDAWRKQSVGSKASRFIVHNNSGVSPPRGDLLLHSQVSLHPDLLHWNNKLHNEASCVCVRGSSEFSQWSSTNFWRPCTSAVTCVSYRDKIHDIYYINKQFSFRPHLRVMLQNWRSGPYQPKSFLHVIRKTFLHFPQVPFRISS